MLSQLEWSKASGYNDRTLVYIQKHDIQTDFPEKGENLSLYAMRVKYQPSSRPQMSSAPRHVNYKQIQQEEDTHLNWSQGKSSRNAGRRRLSRTLWYS